MAMIKCPECGKDISDKAGSCPSCGIILKKEEPQTILCTECGKEILLSSSVCEFCGCPVELKKEKRKFKKKTMILISVATIILIAIGIILFVCFAKPKMNYDKALNLANDGNYKEAYEIIKNCDYEGSDKIEEELRYETYVYSTVTSIKEMLKKPDSFILYSVELLNSDGNTSEDKTNAYGCVLHYGAENGYGGITESYAIGTYDEEEKAFTTPFGSCPTLDGSYYDTPSEMTLKELDEYGVYVVIEAYRSIGEPVEVDIDRVKNIIENNLYQEIDIIK